MNNDFEDKLKQEFPILYTDLRCGDARRSCMAFGLECGDGWQQIVYDLSAKIEKYNNEQSDKDMCVIASQVKEKFGSLRYYISGGSDEVYNWIDEAEHQSSTTCETCGKPGTMNTKGWWYVSCDECNKARSNPVT